MSEDISQTTPCSFVPQRAMTSAKHACCVLLALALASTCTALPSLQVREHVQVTRWQPPPFYHDLDGPHFKVVNKSHGIEERVYEPAKWASTKVDAILYSSAVSTGFKRLFKYISGANKNGANETIPMTVPVKVKVTPGDGPFCTSSFIVSFFIPHYLQEHPPEPTSSDVYIESINKTTYYVSTFGGFAIDPVVILKSKALIAKLDEAGKPIDKSHFYTAGYDPPFRILARTNEIWVRKVESGADDVKAFR